MQPAIWRKPQEPVHQRRRALQLVLLGAFSPRAFAETLTLTSPEYSTASIMDVGRVVVAEAMRRTGMACQIRLVPALRSIEMANNGDSDGDVARIADVADRYPNLIRVPTPVTRSIVAIYAATPDVARYTRADIRKLRIAKTRGIFITAKYSQGLNVTDSNMNTATEMLTSGHVDVMMLEYFDYESRMHVQPVSGISRWPYQWASEPLYLLLHRKHEALIPKVDAALQQMKKEGFNDRAYAALFRSIGIAPNLPAEPVAR